ncbi:MAG: YdcF family protein [Tetrasphaera sp.]|nr:YdcF family protein [Tetrasphaera sp.]
MDEGTSTLVDQRRGGAGAGAGPWGCSRQPGSSILPVVVGERAIPGPRPRVADAPTADVTLVLGAGLTPDDTPSPCLAARLDVAAALRCRRARPNVLLLSGDNRYHDYDEPTAMRTYLVERGVPAERIVLDFAGRDTYDSCSRAKRIFRVDRMLVVSQGYHLPRAVATCQALGIDAQGVGDWSVRDTYDPVTWRWGEVASDGGAQDGVGPRGSTGPRPPTPLEVRVLETLPRLP